MSDRGPLLPVAGEQPVLMWQLAEKFHSEEFKMAVRPPRLRSRAIWSGGSTPTPAPVGHGHASGLSEGFMSWTGRRALSHTCAPPRESSGAMDDLLKPFWRERCVHTHMHVCFACDHTHVGLWAGPCRLNAACSPLPTFLRTSHASAACVCVCAQARSSQRCCTMRTCMCMCM